MSTEAGGQAVVRAQPVSPYSIDITGSFRLQRLNLYTNIRWQFLWFPCGIIRGALASMGINATVQAETSELPGATFQIKSIDVKKA